MRLPLRPPSGARTKIRKEPGARNHDAQCSTAPRRICVNGTAGDRLDGSKKSVVHAAAFAAVAALAGCATARRLAPARRRRAPCSTSPSRCCRSPARARCSRCAASTASAATTPRMRARWVPTRTASRRSSSRSRATRSSSSRLGTTADHPYPPLTKNYHYEIELVAALGKGGAQRLGRRGARPRLRLHDRPRHDAPRPAAAMGDEKKPWEIGKSFDRSAPIGPLHRVATSATSPRARSR